MEGDQQKFARFWSEYPRKVGKGKCEILWRRIKVSDVLLETILTALEAQKHSVQWKRKNGEFIPYPSTWLAQKRWEDEPDNSGSIDKHSHYETRGERAIRLGEENAERLRNEEKTET